VLSDGVVVESGYTSLLREPVQRSWLVPGTVTASRDPTLVEAKEPGAVCAGLVFLTDLPKRKRSPAKVKPFDYVILQAYPAGEYTYHSVGNIQRTVRRFSAGLETAVKLTLESSAVETAPKRYGMDARPKTKAYLEMPEAAGGAVPRLLSQTGAFTDTQNLVPSPSLVPYDLNVHFWSDGAAKGRWMALPNDEHHPDTKIAFHPAGEWAFPKGTVFVKHFELATNELRAELRRRLETRLLVCDSAGGIYGVTYKWRPDNTDAELLNSNLTEKILVQTAAGLRTQAWYYPSREDCRVCHTANAGLVLGVKTRQMNRDVAFAEGGADNQLRTWNHLGFFEPRLDESSIPSFTRLAPSDDLSRSLEDRARSYLDANCAHCHRPNGTVADFDTRYDIPLPEQKLIEGQVLLDQGIDGARAIVPHDIWRSIVYMRANTVDSFKMPPLAHSVVDQAGMALLRQWIESLPGPPVLAPPTLSPAGGDYTQAVSVTLNESEPGAAIHYTLDGTKPTTSDPLYDKPIQLSSPTTVRAKAFKPGFTRSITVQETYIIGN